MRQMMAAAGFALLAMVSMTPASAQPEARRQEQVGDRAIEAARAAVAATDFNRVLRDRPYATEALRNLDLLAGAPFVYAELGRTLESLRLFPLVSLGRPEEVRTTLDRVLAMRPGRAAEYGAPIFAALAIEDLGRFAEVVEAAAANVPASERPELREFLEREAVWPVLNRLRGSNPPMQVRLAAALSRIDWRGSGTDTGDNLRQILLTAALVRRDRAEARSLAAQITSPEVLTPLLVLRRYDDVVPAGADRLAPLRTALASRERTTAEATARDADNLWLRLDRIQHLRALGRNAEALALAQPQLGDPNAAARGSEEGMWIVNEAAYALLDLGRPTEAARLLRGLTDLPIAEHSYLISSMINQGAILSEAGLHAESLEHARRLEREFAEYASDYGDMWIRATVVCALARLDRSAEAAPTLEAMRAAQATNPAALMRSYLCLNDLDAAERLIISRLESDEPEEAVMALQDYALESGPETRPEILVERLHEVRARPAVRAALDRVGRLVQLPIARTYWGGF